MTYVKFSKLYNCTSTISHLRRVLGYSLQKVKSRPLEDFSVVPLVEPFNLCRTIQETVSLSQRNLFRKLTPYEVSTEELLPKTTL